MNANEIRKTILEAVPEESINEAHTEREHRYEREGSKFFSVTTKLGRIDKSYLKQWAVNQGVEYSIEAFKKIGQVRQQDVEDILDASRTRHKDVLRRAGETGTEIHLALERYLDNWIDKGTGNIGSVSDYYHGKETNIIAALRSAEAFFEDYELIPILSEFKVWDEKKEIAGTCDALFLRYEVRKGREGDKDCEHSYDEDAKNKKVHWCIKCGRELGVSIVIADWKSSNSIKKDTYAWQIAAYKYALEKQTGIKVDDAWVIRFSKEKLEYQVMALTNYRKAIQEYTLISKIDASIRARKRDDLLENIIQPLVIKL